jgi:thiamine-monophosphate kinase
VARKVSARGSEQSRIALLRRVLGGSRIPGVELAIGDDAAILRARGRLVWTIDAAVEHVHFELGLITLEDVGYRATQAAVSDLAAMGARPLAALANLSLPPRLSERDFARLVRGQAEAARALGCAIIGGNLARSAELSVTTTVLGTVEKPLVRSGARPGDELWLLGNVGLARAGLLALQAKRRRRSQALRACVNAFVRPRALLAEGRKLVGRASAAVDVSDGLAGDAGHLARSSGVRIAVVEEQLRLVLPDELVEAAAELGHDPLELALFGGEDYALLATGPRLRRPRNAAVIGRVEAGRGVVLETARRRRVLGGGFDHFARARR